MAFVKSDFFVISKSVSFCAAALAMRKVNRIMQIFFFNVLHYPIKINYVSEFDKKFFC